MIKSSPVLKKIVLHKKTPPSIKMKIDLSRIHIQIYIHQFSITMTQADNNQFKYKTTDERVKCILAVKSCVKIGALFLDGHVINCA